MTRILKNSNLAGFQIPSIYVHVPFCSSKCFYCDFNSYVSNGQVIRAYFEALSREITLASKIYDVSKTGKIQTIYFGGGTPSLVYPQYIEGVLDQIRASFVCEDELEITLECNPESIDKDRAEAYKKMGINRLSIGLQTYDDDLLKIIGRIHTKTDFDRAYNLLVAKGFSNINVDLMTGLPYQNFKDLEKSLEHVITLGPQHISTYSLSINEGTPFFDNFDYYSKYLPDDGIERDMYHYISDRLQGLGMLHYEVSNFARPGFESKHNTMCWQGYNYYGFGAGASSYIGDERRHNEDKVDRYISLVHEAEEFLGLYNEIVEKLSAKDRQNEFFLLGFRLLKGVNLEDFSRQFCQSERNLELEGEPNCPEREEYRYILDEMVKEGLLSKEENNYHLNRHGLDFANLVFEKFI